MLNLKHADICLGPPSSGFLTIQDTDSIFRFAKHFSRNFQNGLAMKF